MINYKGISTLEVLKEARNYNRWIAEEIMTHLSAPTLEIGAGTGNLTKHFLGYTPFYITDSDQGLVKNLKKKFSVEKNIFISTLDITKKPPEKFLSFFSSVFAINVLEHIEDDGKALKNIYSTLKKRGTLILLVPAKKKAYSRLDKELGHFRRYEKEELLNKLTRSGYRIEKVYFFNIVGLISWYFRDKASHNKDIHLKPYHIAVFDSIVPFLRIIESYIKIPVGISLIVIAQK